MSISETIWANYDPNSNYLSLKDIFVENAKEYFENAVAQSGISKDECKSLARKYENSAIKKNKTQKATNSFLGLFIAFLVIGVLLFIWFALVLWLQILPHINDKSYSKSDLVSVIVSPILGAILLGLSLGLFLIRYLKNRKQLIRDRINEKKAYDAVIEAIRPLNNLLLKHGIKEEILQKTMPEVKLNKYLMAEWHREFIDEYGGKILLGKDENTYCNSILSGTLFKSPFIFVGKRGWKYVDKEYEGSIVVTWTEIYTAGNETKSRVRSEVLTATVTKPAPEFSDDNFLLFGTNVCTNLNFFRRPTNVNAMNEREIEKFVKKKSDELAKLTEKSIASNDSFRAMNNTKFEVLFNALNRNDEKEFRMMFTPIAQKNMVNLLLDKNNGYGDNFKFTKQGNVNLIENTQLLLDTEIFKKSIECESYSYDQVAELFIQNLTKFFREFYFSIAPLLSIPDYVLSDDETLNAENDSRLSYYELERIAYDAISKKVNTSWTETDFVVNINEIGNVTDKSEEFSVEAQGFSTTMQTDYVTKIGPDGALHTIPVPWTKYDPEYQEFIIKVGKIKNYENKSSYISEFDEVLQEIKDENSPLTEASVLSSAVRIFDN
ncbi:hypothetical protein MBOVa_6030 [Mycoplasmopsis bovis 8790]|nr:hypothetical protein MBOVa_6030 [Mycoplasmopsis bovis 8790]